MDYIDQPFKFLVPEHKLERGGLMLVNTEPIHNGESEAGDIALISTPRHLVGVFSRIKGEEMVAATLQQDYVVKMLLPVFGRKHVGNLV